MQEARLIAQLIEEKQQHGQEIKGHSDKNKYIFHCAIV